MDEPIPATSTPLHMEDSSILMHDLESHTVVKAFSWVDLDHFQDQGLVGSCSADHFLRKHSGAHPAPLEFWYEKEGAHPMVERAFFNIERPRVLPTNANQLEILHSKVGPETVALKFLIPSPSPLHVLAHRSFEGFKDEVSIGLGCGDE
jgi:hypothetical protein